MQQARVTQDDLVRALGFLRAGDWRAAHEIVQRDEDAPLSCWAHGIVHLMEGDTSNARYWYREAKRAGPREPTISEEVSAFARALES
jgi:Tfp pilus assembly protein PilF